MLEQNNAHEPLVSKHLLVLVYQIKLPYGARKRMEVGADLVLTSANTTCG